MRQKKYISLDVGSIAVKSAVFDEANTVVHLSKKRIEGDLCSCLRCILSDLNNKYDDYYIVAISGSGANNLSQLLNIKPINEIKAAFYGALDLVPKSGSILSVGGIKAHFIRCGIDSVNGYRVFRDARNNSRCFSGTGMFIEQEANRLNLSLEQLVSLALESLHPPAIAGRCTVFAKTDIIHKHQNGYSLKDIVGAICQMVARNIAGELIKKTDFDLPLVFIGGMAQNKAICKGLKNILKLDDNSLIVPTDFLFAHAIGSYRYTVSKNEFPKYSLDKVMDNIDYHMLNDIHMTNAFKPLKRQKKINFSYTNSISKDIISNDYLMGIDIGSTNTKIVCIDQSGSVLESCSVPTGGQPLDAVRKIFDKMDISNNGTCPKAVGVTGSGRKYISNIFKADIAINEITAHAEAGIRFFPEVETIIDIGGQDSKYIRIDNGRVTGFEMNKVCSAGTGSFLEETADFLGLDIRTEFSDKAFTSNNPIDLGDRCTVFMNLVLAQRQNRGFKTSDIAAGLAYSVVNNYISRVIRQQSIGRNISFQGGVAGNQSVVAALEQVLNRTIFVHPYYEIAGAYGAAIIAGRTTTKESSQFVGYELAKTIKIRNKSFQCGKCGNYCLINYMRTNDNRRIYGGGVCDRYDEKSEDHTMSDTSPLEFQRKLLLHYFGEEKSEISSESIGIPAAMHFTELLPFWTTFLKDLGVKYSISPSTTRDMLQNGSEASPSGICLPLKIAYGHCLHLQQTGIKKLFVPSIKNLSFKTRAERLNHICPAAQAWPYTLASLLSKEVEIISPTVNMALPHKRQSDLIAFGKSLGYNKKEVKSAISKAVKAEDDLFSDLQTYTRHVLNNADSDKYFAVIFARPYVFSDYQIISRLQPILSKLNIVAIPFNMLISDSCYSSEVDGMYWYYGKRFLQTALTMKSIKNSVGIFLSVYSCGTDSLLIHQLRDAMGGTPFLELEIDQHCDFTGLETRLEAFFYSLRNNMEFNVNRIKRRKDSPFSLKGRKVFIPQMADHAFACASALKSLGQNAEVMPLTGEKAMHCGKKVINSGECLPCTMLAGDMLNILDNGNGLTSPAFFIISGDGPCRLGQYTYLLRKVLDESGHEKVPIIDMSQDTAFYSKLDIVSSAFKKRFWEGSIAIDILSTHYHRLRCLTSEYKLLDCAYRNEVTELCNCIDDRKKLAMQLRQSFDKMDKFKTDIDNPEVTIGLVGENYIRCNPSANQQIIKRLEEMKVNVRIPQLTEWIYYTNWTARLHCLYDKKYSQYLKLHLINIIQRLQAFQLNHAVRKRLTMMDEPSLNRLFNLASAYVPRSFEGETIISIGRTIDYYLKGVNGIIHVSPFGCMAGTIYETISQKLSDDLNGLPILNLQFDGQKNELQQEELESFIFLAKSWKLQKEC